MYAELVDYLGDERRAYGRVLTHGHGKLPVAIVCQMKT